MRRAVVDAIPAANVIKEAYPNAKVILTGPDPLAWDFIEASLKAGLASLVDVIAWHQYQWTMPPEVLTLTCLAAAACSA